MSQVLFATSHLNDPSPRLMEKYVKSLTIEVYSCVNCAVAVQKSSVPCALHQATAEIQISSQNCLFIARFLFLFTFQSSHQCVCYNPCGRRGQQIKLGQRGSMPCAEIATHDRCSFSPASEKLTWRPGSNPCPPSEQHSFVATEEPLWVAHRIRSVSCGHSGIL